MKRLGFLAAMFLAVASYAGDPTTWGVCIEYLNSNTTARAPMDFAFQEGPRGSELAVWNLPTPKPTLAQLDAVLPQALAWKANQVAIAAADIDGMDLQMKAVIRALLKVVNERLPAEKKISEAELKAAIKESVR